MAKTKDETKTKLRAAIYTRVSTERQAGEDKTSLDMQVRRCEEKCKAEDWEIIAHHQDAGISGETVDGRPGIRNALIDAAGGKYDVLVAYTQDRLGRSSEAFAQIGGTLKAAGVLLATCDRGLVDLTMPEDRFTYNIFAAVAEYEKERIRKRVADARKERLDAARFASRMDPYGYDWNSTDKRPEVNEAEAPTVKLIFDLCLQGLSLVEIAENLRARAIPSRSETVWTAAQEQKVEEGKRRPNPKPSRPWGPSTVGVVLRNSSYMGEWILQQKPLIVAKNPPRAIIDRETWGQAQKVIARNRKRRRQHLTRDFLLGEGIMVCGECGGTMTGREGERGHRYYVCNRAVRKDEKSEACNARQYIRAERVEDRVWGLVEELVENPEAVEAYLKDAKEVNVAGLEEEKARIRDKAAGEKTKRKRLLKMHVEGYMPAEEFKAWADDFADDQLGREIRLREIDQALAEYDARSLTVRTVQRVLADISDRMDTLSVEEQRGVLKQLLVHVTFRGADHAKPVLVEWAGEAILPSGAGSRLRVGAEERAQGSTPVGSDSGEQAGRSMPPGRPAPPLADGFDYARMQAEFPLGTELRTPTGRVPVAGEGS